MSAENQTEQIRPEHPIHYRFPPFVRWGMVLVTSMVCIYSLYFMIKVVNTDTPAFFKILPLMVMFVAFDSVLRHLTSLNCVTFYEDKIGFSYIIKPKLEINYSDILYMELRKHITYYVQFRYLDAKGTEKVFSTPASFPKTLEIMLIIADLAPNIKLSDKLSSAVQHMRNKTEEQ
ncbi:MAG: hypothetical protein PHY48_08750 [Candidatus Cloacimonetes bacterium]|nr:hypothetical protein [Candidatus Cloacimonadota bacterium]